MAMRPYALSYNKLLVIADCLIVKSGLKNCLFDTCNNSNLEQKM